MRTKATTYAGWLRKDRRIPWQLVCRGTYEQCEGLLAQLPVVGKKEECQILPSGQKPIGKCERGDG
jgi:hypothetical protein